MDQKINNLQSSLKRLDKLIYDLELNVGFPHSKSPFEKFYSISEKNDLNTTKLINNIEKEECKINKEIQKNLDINLSEEIKSLFKCIDLRVGKIIECWPHKDSEKLYCEKIDLGFEIREIASGVQKEVPLNEMSGLVIVAINLKPKKLAGFMSNGMVLMACDKEKSIIELIRPDSDAKPGDRVTLEGLEYLTKEKENELSQIKNLEKYLKNLKINEKGIAQFNGMNLKLEKSLIQSKTLKNVPIS